MYSEYNESKSVNAKRFIKTLKGKIYKRSKCNDSNSYRVYFNKLIDKQSYTYHRAIAKKPADVHYSSLIKKIESSHKASKLVIESGLLSTRIFLAKLAPNIGQEKYLLLIMC